MEIILYSSPNCLNCTRLKEELSEKNITYIEYDVFNNGDARNELINEGYHSIPVMRIIDNNVQLFFNIVDIETKQKVFDIIGVTQ